MEKTEIEPETRYDLLRDDMTNVAVWIRNRYPGDNHVLMVDYYHHQKSRKEIAYVVILGPEQEQRRAIRADATRALEALGCQRGLRRLCVTSKIVRMH